MNKFFATTPIYYVNDVPHLGHAYPTIAADVLTRYWAHKGYDAKLLTGTDEHGAKIAQAAKEHGKEPKDYADEISEKFKQAWKNLNINYVRFIRTTDDDHIKIAQAFLQKLYDKGAIDPKPRLYKGLYCISCEKFWAKEDLKDGLCPDHLKPPVEHSEENYYFRLSKYKKRLIALINNEGGKKIEVLPVKRQHEILSKLERGLEDISISRANLEWGIPLPFDKNHTSYVWIEALINYYTYGSQNNYWPADLHLVGKDILWFHSVVWPAMLLAIGEDLPRKIFAHGFFTINGQKMSKTIGNVIHPDDLVKKYGVDGARYVLLAAFPFGEDGDFSWDLFDRIYNADLANGLGNLVGRVAMLCQKNNLAIPSNPIEQELKDKVKWQLFFNDLNFFGAIEYLKLQIQEDDKKINEEKPWELEGEKAKIVLEDLVKRIQAIGYNLQPFLPQTAEKILKQFSGKIKSSAPLFPRI
ncbi:methionine--tRNA ligase [Candidatus Daviesbacteria bacterium]|nr:methionine--tRNA ligase [Candidatus Daviesbacteria bacterium]